MKNNNNILKTNIDALNIARYILYKEAFEDIGDYDYSAHLQNISLQNKLYFGQVIALRYFNKELFCDEMQAWKHGAVQTEVYTNFKYNRKILISNISSPLGDFEEFIIDTIYEMTKNLSPQKLIEISHADNGAWKKYYKPNEHRIIIPKECIRNDIPEDFLVLVNAYFKEKRRYDKNLVSNLCISHYF